MLLSFFRWLNARFPKTTHPFNEGKPGEKLSYANFEFEHAAKTVDLYEKVFEFRKWLPEKVLADFACGGGGKSLYLASLGAGICGIDMNENFIGQARKMAEEKGLSLRAKFIVGDCCKTGLPDESFDGVILNDAIDHIKNPKAAIEEAMRILKPSGLIFVNFESYLFPRGHHLHDAIRIPWIHLFTTESFRMKLYKELVKDLPDGEERLKFRVGYLNHLTIRGFKNILKDFELDRKHQSLRQKAFHKLPLRRKPFQILSKVPFLDELFSSTHLWVLEKTQDNVIHHSRE